MNDLDRNSCVDLQKDVMDSTILSMYKSGYSLDFIVKKYYKYKNKYSKPIIIDGVKMYPAKIYDLEFCRSYVVGVVYEYILHCND